MKQAYINCLKKLREFRKCLNSENDFKRGKLYFTWIKDKTENELFVLPISSKKLKEYRKLEQDYNDKKITLEECEKKKSKITEIV